MTSKMLNLLIDNSSGFVVVPACGRGKGLEIRGVAEADEGAFRGTRVRRIVCIVDARAPKYGIGGSVHVPHS